MTTTTSIAPPARFQAVPFHDTTVLAARVGDEIRVPMRNFCGTVGLPWDGQRQRIQRDEVLREGASMMLVPTARGEQKQLALPLDLIPGFLFGADADRFAPEVRERVRTFRRECFAVLHAHFFKAATAPVPMRPAVPAWQELDAARRSAPALIEAITAETRPAVRRYLHGLLDHDADRLGIAAPALDKLGRDGLSADALVERLVAGLQLLTERRRKWNHFGEKFAGGRMAILLPEIDRLFRRHDIDVPIDAGLRDALDAGNSRYRVTRAVMPSALQRQNIFATILAPWPIVRGEG